MIAKSAGHPFAGGPGTRNKVSRYSGRITGN